MSCGFEGLGLDTIMFGVSFATVVVVSAFTFYRMEKYLDKRDLNKKEVRKQIE